MSAMMEAQAETARRILWEMEHPTPIKPEVAAKAAAFEARMEAWATDEAAGHYHSPRRAYDSARLALHYEAAGDDECWEWDGDFGDDRRGHLYPVLPGAHAFCGRAHFWAARAIFEEHLGRPLETYEVVYGQCETNLGAARRACVNPRHHSLKERG